ncbi:MAG: heparinase II/III-family protein [bacterium]|nr:heparinase II/III-family protein [bacterium]
MEMRYKEAAEAFLTEGRDLLEFRPFPAAWQREAWERLPEPLRTRLIAQGEACLNKPWPLIRATDFMAFKRTGNRVNYENLYFEKRYRLNSLALAECVENKGRFLDDIIDGIFAVCEESAWQLPPHNSYRRSDPQEILPDVSRPVLDLFACETGAQLACIRYLLWRQLNEVSPHIVTRIAIELEKRIAAPYLHRHFWWMGNGDEPMCNWTPWCTQNVLLTVFLNGCDQPLGKAVLAKAAESCDLFLKDYGEDGCCDEGAQYFRRAGLCLDAATDLMNQITGGSFAHLYRWEKLQNIALYIANVHVDGKYYFNFADCSPVAGRAGVREFLFGKRTGRHDLMRFAAEDYRAAQDEIYEEEIYQLNLYYRVQNAFHFQEVTDYAALPAAPAVFGDIFYPSIGLFIARSKSFCLAVKAGNNGDNHNHNDTGSLTLYKNGLPLLADIGVESYTAKTFSSRRYEIWTMQSCYHNLPTLEGLDQRDGAEYGAKDTVVSLRDQTASISMELAGAYPFPSGTHSYRRQVTLEKNEDRVLLTDRTDCGNVILNFITYEKPEATEEHTLQIGDAAFCFYGAELLALDILPVEDPRLRTAWDHDLYRIRLRMTAPVFELEIR